MFETESLEFEAAAFFVCIVQVLHRISVCQNVLVITNYIWPSLTSLTLCLM